jgi:hypothetical protein
MLPIQMRTQMTCVSAAVVSLVSISAWVMASPQDSPEQLQAVGKVEKIDSGVRAQAKDGGSIRVLITLMQQPQTETYRRAEARHQTSLDGATDRYMQAVHQGSVPDNVRTLAAVMDSIILATRQETFQEVRQQIQAEQDCLAARLAGLGATDIHR